MHLGDLIILDSGQVSLALDIIDYATFALVMQLNIHEAHFVLELPLYNPIIGNFSSLFENVVVGNLKSFFQLDHQVDITLYFTEAAKLHHSGELDNHHDVLSIPLAFWLPILQK